MGNHGNKEPAGQQQWTDKPPIVNSKVNNFTPLSLESISSKNKENDDLATSNQVYHKEKTNEKVKAQEIMSVLEDHRFRIL